MPIYMTLLQEKGKNNLLKCDIKFTKVFKIVKILLKISTIVLFCLKLNGIENDG